MPYVAKGDPGEVFGGFFQGPNPGGVSQANYRE